MVAGLPRFEDPFARMIGGIRITRMTDTGIPFTAKR